jgi:dolichol-phosphate mannosyltransferase
MSDATEPRTHPRENPPHNGDSLLPYAERINVGTALAGLADALIFLAATGAGVPLGPAHIFGFIVASALNYQLNIRVAVATAGRTRDLRLFGHLIVVSLLALFLRGGVLALLTNSWGWPSSIAIFIAIGASLAVTLPGYAFCLSTQSTWRLGSRAQWQVLALGLVIYALVLRLVYLGQAELLPEETYYWSYSRHLDIGYLDHPPMVAWLIKLSTSALGTSQFGVRVSAVFCAAITAFFTYRLTRNLFDASSALVATVLSQVLPFFFVAGIIMTPDTPLVAAWAGELYFLERALIAGRSRAWWGAGICMGLGLLSKYSMGLLAPAALAFVLLDPQSRRWLRQWQPYAAALIALAIFSPVILWNAQNEWASFAFQTSRRLTGAPQFALHKLILAALVLITPTGCFAAAAAVFGRRQYVDGPTAIADARRKWRFMQLAVAVPLAVFAGVSIRHNVKFDWTGELWLAAVPVMAFALTSCGERLSQKTFDAKIRAAWTPTLLALLVIYAAGLHYLVLGLPGIGYGEQMHLVPIGWRDLGQQVNSIAKEIGRTTGAEPLVVGMDRYAIASEVAFYGNDDAAMAPETSAAHLFGWTGLMYARWVPVELQAGRTLLLVTWKPEDLADSCVESHADRLGPVKVGVLAHDSTVIRLYYYRVLYGYRSSATCATS